MRKRDRKQLLRAFNEDMPEALRLKLENKLQESETLCREKKEYSEVREVLARNTETSFGPGFTDRVMRRIRNEAVHEPGEDFFESLIRLFRPLVLGAALVIIMLLSYNTIRNGGSMLSGIVKSPDVTMQEVFEPTLVFME